MCSVRRGLVSCANVSKRPWVFQHENAARARRSGWHGIRRSRFCLLLSRATRTHDSPPGDAVQYRNALICTSGCSTIHLVVVASSFLHSTCRCGRRESPRRRATGDPAREILLHTRTRKMDLIVLGSNQRRGWQRAREGSVSASTAAAWPVLVVPWDARRTGVLSEILSAF